MLGTACDLTNDGRHTEQPAGCFTDISKEGVCKSPRDAVRGLCKLHRIVVPDDSPIGGTSKQYEIFRALDPGTQIKLHLYKARSYWSQGIDIMMWSSNRALNRWLGRLTDPENTVIERDSVPVQRVFVFPDQYDALLGLVRGAKDSTLKPRWDQIAPEYDNVLPAGHQYKNVANRMTVLSDGGYEPFPIYYKGNQNPAVVPDKYTKNPTSSFRTGHDAVTAASRHLFYAMAIALFYHPSAADRDVPYGAMAFLTPTEMSALTALVRIFVESDPTLLAKKPMSTDTVDQRIIYSEILRFLVAGSRDTDVEAHYKDVVADTDAAMDVSRRFLEEMFGALGRLPNAAPARNSAVATEITKEGGKAYARAMQ